MKPLALKPGDTIGIAASASPFDPHAFRKGVNVLKSMGFKVYYHQNIFHRQRYLAGSDKRRTDELVKLLRNPKIKAILFARGGYGLMRVLPFLDKRRFKSEPKIILGYSDITTLLTHFYQKLGWTTFYGPVIAKDLSPRMSEETKQHLFSALTQTTPLGPFCFSESISLRKGTCKGILVGGCLSLIVASLGTPYEINTDNKILFLEDINEKPYSVDRMLTHLVLAKKLRKVRGIILGHFANGGKLDYFQETAMDVLKDFKGPILFNFPAGHGSKMVTLPLGIRVRLSADKKKLEYLESALR